MTQGTTGTKALGAQVKPLYGVRKAKKTKRKKTSSRRR